MMMTMNSDTLNSNSPLIGHNHHHNNLFTRSAIGQQPQALLDKLASLHD
jgi:hypothetical protein